MTLYAGDELYDDDVTSGVTPSYPISGPGLEPSGMTPVRAADGPGATSSDGGSPETERATASASPDRTHLIDEAVERIRSHHDRTLGHAWTSVVGYCAEPDGISATYCETGILLERLRS